MAADDNQQLVKARDDSELEPIPLFRPEVLAERETRQLGTVLMASPLSHWLFSAFGCGTVLAIVAMLIYGEFTRKSRIRGWLAPQHGLVRVHSPQAGIATDVLVREGMEVAKGQPLLTLSTELQSEALGATRREIVHRLALRRDSVVNERRLHIELHTNRMGELGRRIAALKSEQDKLSQQINAQARRVAIAKSGESRLQELRGSGWVTEQSLERATEQKLEQTIRLGNLERSLADARSQMEALQEERRSLPIKHQTQLSELDRSIAAIEQEIAENEARREIVIPAPESGTVTSIQAERGGSIATTVPLLTIIPSASRLDAQLFGPSSSIGFLRAGQRVLIRYQAFPYQKFGQHEGTVADISRSPISPGELSQHLSGFRNIYGNNEPIYRISVSLAKQAVMAYGEQIALQPGMQLEADVILERRRLYEWLLDPLYTITGKLER